MVNFIAISISIVSVLVCGLMFWQFRKKQQQSAERLSNRINGLLTEFNELSSRNIDLLDDRTEKLRRVVDLADAKIKKLNRLIDQAEGAKKFLKKQSEPPEGSSNQVNSSHRQKVLELAEDGYNAQEIADRTDVNPGEVSVIIRLNRSRVAGS